jgi:hypothetical protein
MLNQIANYASIIGLLISLPAFILVLVQLHRTKKSADASAESSREAFMRVAILVAVVSIERICSRSRDVLILIKGQNYKGAAIAVLELRDAIAKLSSSKAGLQLQTAEKWSEQGNEVCEIHETIERAASLRKCDSPSLILKLSNICSQFSSLASIASDKAGEINAHSKRVS